MRSFLLKQSMKIYENSDEMGFDHSVIIFAPHRVYEIIPPGYATDILNIYVDEMGEDYIVYRKADCKSGKPIGKATKLSVKEPLWFSHTGRGSSVVEKEIVTAGKHRFELTPVDFMKDMDSLDPSIVGNALRGLIESEETPLEKKKEYLEILSSRFGWLDYAYKVYAKGLYGIGKDEGKMMDILSSGIGRERLQKWLKDNGEVYDSLLETLDPLAERAGGEWHWSHLSHLSALRKMLEIKILFSEGDESGVEKLDALLTNSFRDDYPFIYEEGLREMAEFAATHEVNEKNLETAKNDYAVYLVIKDGGDIVKETMKYHIEQSWNDNTCRLESEDVIPEGFDLEKVRNVLQRHADNGDFIAQSLLGK
ncbi:MAG: hypothetical protein K6E59_00575 [Bacilli bacterium]|nr:hypothetical protein [Bacilli bacterium]